MVEGYRSSSRKTWEKLELNRKGFTTIDEVKLGSQVSVFFKKTPVTESCRGEVVKFKRGGPLEDQISVILEVDTNGSISPGHRISLGGGTAVRLLKDGFGFSATDLGK